MPTAPDDNASWPRVSVIVPIRNEADFIERCLRSILSNDYPGGQLDVLVVDGMSDDGTRPLVQRLAGEDARVRLLDNLHQLAAHAMNIGIRAARGEIVIRVDGHATVAPDFVRQNVLALRAHPEAWCVGGPVTSVNTGLVGRAIALAMSSPVGVGDAKFRLGHYEGYVGTLAFGAYRRWVFDRIGLFDEELARNQDDCFNTRLNEAGGKIWMTPRIRSEYYPRASLGKLARQYYQYGFWRIRVLQKRHSRPPMRRILPLVFVLCWLGLLGGATLLTPDAFDWALGAFAALYLLGLAVGTVDVARHGGVKPALLAPAVFGILHFAYGIGSLVGVYMFVLRQGKRVTSAHAYQMSR